MLVVGIQGNRTRTLVCRSGSHRAARLLQHKCKKCKIYICSSTFYLHTAAICWFLLVSLLDSPVWNYNHLPNIFKSFFLFVYCVKFAVVLSCLSTLFCFIFFKVLIHRRRKKNFIESTHSRGHNFHSITRLFCFFLFIDTYLSAAEHFSAFCALH